MAMGECLPISDYRRTRPSLQPGLTSWRRLALTDFQLDDPSKF